jgi:hypothetical protein
MKHLLLTTAVVATVTGALAGCSSGASAPAHASSATAGPTAAATQPTAAGGSASPHESAVPAEQNPPGDIPDNLAFVPYVSAAGHYRFNHPEGWLETTSGKTVLLTDKLNGVTASPGAETSAPTVASARQRDLPALQASQPAFELRTVTAVTEPGGTGVRIVYRRNSAADPVTGRKYRDEVQRYELVSGGREVVLEMFGPVGADNVDAYRTMVQSLRLQ